MKKKYPPWVNIKVIPRQVKVTINWKQVTKARPIPGIVQKVKVYDGVIRKRGWWGRTLHIVDDQGVGYKINDRRVVPKKGSTVYLQARRTEAPSWDRYASPWKLIPKATVHALTSKRSMAVFVTRRHKQYGFYANGTLYCLEGGNAGIKKGMLVVIDRQKNGLWKIRS